MAPKVAPVPNDDARTDVLESPAEARAALEVVPPLERDAWADALLGLRDVPEDGPELPPGGVPYLPCAIEALREVASVLGPHDVVVDLGSGVGRAAAVLAMLSGAEVVGVEIQPALVSTARVLAARVPSLRLHFIEGDAAELPGRAPEATLFFLYCPFGGARLDRLLERVEAIAHTREVRLACVDLPLPPRPWLEPLPSSSPAVTMFRATSSRR